MNPAGNAYNIYLDSDNNGHVQLQPGSASSLFAWNGAAQAWTYYGAIPCQYSSDGTQAECSLPKYKNQQTSSIAYMQKVFNVYVPRGAWRSGKISAGRTFTQATVDFNDNLPPNAGDDVFIRFFSGSQVSAWHLVPCHGTVTADFPADSSQYIVALTTPDGSVTPTLWGLTVTVS